jgi:hypothetical protein
LIYSPSQKALPQWDDKALNAAGPTTRKQQDFVEKTKTYGFFLEEQPHPPRGNGYAIERLHTPEPAAARMAAC